MSVKETIARTVATFSPGGDPSALFSIAKRESAFNPNAVGDATIAPKVYEKKRDELRAMGNPWADVPERWAGSFGLYQLMAPYFARIWSPTADPFDLFDPTIATVVAGRLWNRAVALGARNPVEVRLVWAFGPKGLQYGPGTEEYDKRLKTEQARFESLGYPASYALRGSGFFGYGGFGKSPTSDQWAKLKISPTEQTPDDVVVDEGYSLAFPALLMLAGGGLLAYAARKSA